MMHVVGIPTCSITNKYLKYKARMYLDPTSDEALINYIYTSHEDLRGHMISKLSILVIKATVQYVPSII